MRDKDYDKNDGNAENDENDENHISHQQQAFFWDKRWNEEKHETITMKHIINMMKW